MQTQESGMSWVIIYEDGAYESDHGSGFPCRLLEEAGKFPTREAAEEHSVALMDVREIKEL
jgi:hypothetical protein